MVHPAAGQHGTDAWGDWVDTTVADHVATLAAVPTTYVPKGTRDLFVADYGAIGNGTTDDTTALTAALSAARTAKARLTFGFGLTYVVSGQLDPTGVIIAGNGATLKIKAGVTPAWNLFQPYGACFVNNLQFDLNKANTTDPGTGTASGGIYGYSGSGWSGTMTFRDVTIINGYTAGFKFGTLWSITDAINAPASAVLLDNVTVDGCNTGVYAFGISGLAVINPTITGIAAVGIQDILSLDTEIIGGKVSGTGDHGICTTYSNGFSCQGARVADSGGDGIVVGGGDVTLKEAINWTLTGNVVKGSTLNGISIDTTKTGALTTPVVVDATIHGNVLRDNTIHGIYLHNAEYAAVTGNVARGNGNAGIALDSRHISMSGNTLYGNAYGIAFQGLTGNPYGYHEVGRNVVVNNTVSDYSFDTLGAPGTTLQLSGTGTPQAVVAAPVGSTFVRTDGGTSTALYVKETGGFTSTGWVAK